MLRQMLKSYCLFWNKKGASYLQHRTVFVFLIHVVKGLSVFEYTIAI